MREGKVRSNSATLYINMVVFTTSRKPKWLPHYLVNHWRRINGNKFIISHNYNSLLTTYHLGLVQCGSLEQVYQTREQKKSEVVWGELEERLVWCWNWEQGAQHDQSYQKPENEEDEYEFIIVTRKTHLCTWPKNLLNLSHWISQVSNGLTFRYATTVLVT